jgi:hypothetical protein
MNERRLLKLLGGCDGMPCDDSECSDNEGGYVQASPYGSGNLGGGELGGGNIGIGGALTCWLKFRKRNIGKAPKSYSIKKKMEWLKKHYNPVPIVRKRKNKVPKENLEVLEEVKVLEPRIINISEDISKKEKVGILREIKNEVLKYGINSIPETLKEYFLEGIKEGLLNISKQTLEQLGFLTPKKKLKAKGVLGGDVDEVKPKPKRKLTEYNKFVRDNYAQVKEDAGNRFTQKYAICKLAKMWNAEKKRRGIK